MHISIRWSNRLKLSKDGLNHFLMAVQLMDNILTSSRTCGMEDVVDLIIFP